MYHTLLKISNHSPNHTQMVVLTKKKQFYISPLILHSDIIAALIILHGNILYNKHAIMCQNRANTGLILPESGKNRASSALLLHGNRSNNFTM